MSSSGNSNINKLSLAGIIVTMGIVYGDIGTSPLYVMSAILKGASVITPDYIVGAVSCIIWTLFLQTTIKYVLITLRVDNKGEGGILALYALLRKKKGYIFLFAILGASSIIADGFITPSITVVSAVEGLQITSPGIPVIPIVIGILTVLFVFQQFGTNKIGRLFGPVMFIWFIMLAVLGTSHIIEYPYIFKSFNPYYGLKLLFTSPSAFFIMGAVFLCTTGAEALYSDLGHCGLKNIRISWVFVKISLIINYLGQGAWVISHPSEIIAGTNPFFAIMPSWFLFTGVIISTFAAVIASQALISGSYTIISEAIHLNFWPKVKVLYPSDVRGQMYIPMVNWMLYFACVFVVLFFQKSSNMEAAYGLTITLSMIMTTSLLVYYFYKRINIFLLILFFVVYMTIEGAFLIANLHKFFDGGWFTILMSGIFFFIMYNWYKGRQIKIRYTQFVKIKDYAEVLKDLKNDETITKYATNLIYLTRADYSTDIESKIIYSIINKQPKRADKYWFVHVHVLDEPKTMEYSIECLIPDVLYRIEFRIGFKVSPKVNLFFRQAVEEMVYYKEFDLLSNYPSLRKHEIPADFRFVLISRIQTYDYEFSTFEQFVMKISDIIRNIGISDIKAFGLDTSNVLEEKVPLIVKGMPDVRLKRVQPEKELSS